MIHRTVVFFSLPNKQKLSYIFFGLQPWVVGMQAPVGNPPTPHHPPMLSSLKLSQRSFEAAFPKRKVTIQIRGNLVVPSYHCNYHLLLTNLSILSLPVVHYYNLNTTIISLTSFFFTQFLFSISLLNVTASLPVPVRAVGFEQCARL